MSYACIYADTSKRRFDHFEFFIEESIDGWEWTHKNFAENGITGTCQCVFEAIEAADDWHHQNRRTALSNSERTDG